MNWEEIKEFFGKAYFPELYEEIFNAKNERNRCLNELYDIRKDLKKVTDDYNKLPKENTTSLERYCNKTYMEIPNKAYESKRTWQTKPISVYINQFIEPDQFEVQRLRRKIPKGVTLREDAYNIGNKVAKSFVWTSDSNLDTSGDYYLYPEEIIVDKKGDCEDHSFTVSSLNPEIGVAYGFYKGGGHAFNVFMENGKLYILETTGNTGKIKLYKNQTDYVIHYIVTKDKTYRVKGGTEFGRIAGW